MHLVSRDWVLMTTGTCSLFGSNTRSRLSSHQDSVRQYDCCRRRHAQQIYIQSNWRQSQQSGSDFNERSGEVSVVAKDNNGIYKRLGVFGPGNFFGEMSIFSDAVRASATLVASKGTKLQRISPKALLPLFEAYPDLARRYAISRHLSTYAILTLIDFTGQPVIVWHQGCWV